MTLVKATIEILDAELAGGRLPEVIPVQFNPNDITLRKRANFAEIALPGLDTPLIQYVRGGAEILELELFCDTTKGGTGVGAQDVREFTEPLHQLVKLQPETQAPPRIRFSWGPGLAFKAVVTDVEQSFTMFSPDGVPLRATVKLTLKEFKTLKEQLAEQNRKLGRVVGRGGRGRRKSQPAGQALEAIEARAPVIKVAVDGKPLDPTVVVDILEAVVHDDSEASDSFELTINNWDDERHEFKYDDSPLFEPGRTIKLWLGYAGDAGLREMMTGKVEKLSQEFPAGGGPTLRVTGTGTRRRARAPRTKTAKPVYTLTYGRSLIQFNPEVTLARQTARTPVKKSKKPPPARHKVTASGSTIGLPDLRAGVYLRIDGVGSRFNGSYFVTSTTHSIASGGYTTRFVGQRPDEERAVPARRRERS